MNSLSKENQSLFTAKAKSGRITAMAFWVISSVIILYEYSRVIDLGFDPLRFIVYIPMSAAILTLCFFVPLINHFRWRKIISHYEHNEVDGTWVIFMLYDKKSNAIVVKQPVEGIFIYYGNEYKSLIFNNNDKLFYFPL